ncbi:NACHT domain-containing protein [Actinophytocola algeriensis]|uniref:NACHT domain-containing protein n=1 Tax=Actinophytocola algeriensis TaxID=1768010 RepID=A0A7W7QFH1_9PSEU|nr:hypothetical protein [Actinophytocola algeriensis]MBB4912647.1 hypothetical protein [Actinophytocola algeriensis]MBE1472019.1 hypothetical protein [Actinophytocola algeriensis]
MSVLFPHAGTADGDAIPFRVHMEADHSVDDLLIVSESGLNSYVQAKADRNVRRAVLDTLKQWVKAVATGDTQDDALVLCTADLSTVVGHLSRALTRLRDPYAQAPSSSEQAALDEFTKEILALSPKADETGLLDELLRRVVIWHADCGNSGSPAVTAACTMLGSLLGGYDKGYVAFSLLRDEVSDLAQLRSGLDIDQARALLTKAGLVSARSIPTSTRSALVRYRTGVRDRARELAIPGLPLDIRPLPVPRLLGNLRVRCRGFVDSRYVSARAYQVVPLTVLARRVPRITLLGGPGSGKTTALIHLAAATAGQAAAPMPIMVRLGKLADRFKHERDVEIADHVLVGAMDVPTLDAAEADLVRSEALARIRTGRALVMLDALDETGYIRQDVARALKSWLDTIHDDLRVIVSSRDTAYSSVAILGLTEAELGPPSDLDDTVRRVVEHAADWSGRPDRDDDIATWLAKRVLWLRMAVGEHWAMMDIPLYAMHIAALAAATRFADLPPNNALALNSVVESVWLRWEAGVRRQGADPLPGLPDRDSSADAFNSTFSLVTEQLEDRGRSVDALAATIAKHLEADYGSPRGLARTSARQLLAMWDDAGLFVAHGPDSVVTARTKLLIELGRAIRISTMSEEEKGARIRELIDDSEQREIILFVVAFDRSVRDLVTRLSVEEKEVPAALALGTAYRRDPSGFADCILGTIDTLIAGLLDEQCPQFVSIALLLAHLPVPDKLRDEVRSAAQRRLPPVWGAVFEAIAAYEWAVREKDPDQLVLDLPDAPPPPPVLDPSDVLWRLAAFRKVLTLPEPPERDVKLTDLEWKIEPGYALVKAAEEMAPVDPEVVTKARLSPLVLDGHTALHLDMLAADHADLPYGSAAAQSPLSPAAVLRSDVGALATLITMLAAPSAQNPEYGDWSLDIVIEVLRVAELHLFRPGVIDDIVTLGRDTLVSLLHDIAAFLGFTPQDLAGSAASCIELLPQDLDDETAIDYQWSAILYGGDPEWIDTELPYRIDTTEDSDGRRQRALDHIVSVALSDDPIALYAAAVLLDRLGSGSPSMVANTLRPRLASLDSRKFIKAPATLSALVCKLDPNAIAELQNSHNPAVRWGVLETVTHHVVCEGEPEARILLELMANDPDRTVRFAIENHLRQHDTEFSDAVEELIHTKLTEAASYWSCVECGATCQPMASPTCQSCGESTQPSLTDEVTD